MRIGYSRMTVLGLSLASIEDPKLQDFEKKLIFFHLNYLQLCQILSEHHQCWAVFVLVACQSRAAVLQIRRFFATQPNNASSVACTHRKQLAVCSHVKPVDYLMCEKYFAFQSCLNLTDCWTAPAWTAGNSSKADRRSPVIQNWRQPLEPHFQI